MHMAIIQYTGRFDMRYDCTGALFVDNVISLCNIILQINYR